MPRKKTRIRRKVVVGHDPAGNPVVKWAIGYTNKEVEDKKKELISDFVTGGSKKLQETLYRHYVQQWYDTYKKSKLSASSKQNYAGALNNHILPYIGDKQLRAVTSIDLQSVMNRLDGHGKTLIGDVYSILTNSFMRAYASGMIDRDPSVGLERPGTNKVTKRALTEKETSAVLHVGANHEHGLLLLLLYYTGIRRGEALGLQWRDIDFENRTISINRDVDFSTGDIGDVKTPAAIRSIPMPQSLCDVLRPVRGLPSVHVIQAPNGSFLSQATYIRWWKQLMAAMLADSPGINKCVVSTRKVKRKVNDKSVWVKEDVYGSVLTAHYFRHNYASVLYAAGVDVLTAQTYLGHSDPKTTMSIYTHLSDARKQTDSQRVCDAFDKPSSPSESADTVQ